MMNKKRFLDIVSKYSFFVHEEDKSFKILPGYHQFFAVNKALYTTHLAASENGSRKAGVIWHTQGIFTSSPIGIKSSFSVWDFKDFTSDQVGLK